MRNTNNALDMFFEFLQLNKLHRIKHLLGVVCCVIGLSFTGLAAPSNLDPTFGSLGKVISSPDSTATFTSSGMALQTDGKIVIVGNRVQSSAYAGMIVARYNPDGSLDTTFGTSGWSSVSFGSQFEFAADVAVQADGKIVIGGTNRNIVNNMPFYEFAVVRFNADGSLDTTFDGDGKLLVDFNNLIGVFYQENLTTLKIAGDGKIVAAGYALDPGVADRFVVARINTDGSLDTTFGNNGKVADVTRASNYDRVGDMVILPDGKIVLVGFHFGLGGSRRIAVKFSSSGAKEWEYNAGVSGSFVPQTEILNGVAALPDGKLIVVGKRAGKIALMRLNADGTEDTTFVSQSGMPDGLAMDVAVHADGKIVATISSSQFSLVRWNANGSLDTSFGIGGFVNTSVSSGQDYTSEMLLQPDGKILVSGTSQFGSPTGYYISMVRYMGAAANANKPFFDYDGDGKADISVFRPSENRWYILQSSNYAVRDNVFALAGDIPTPADFDGDGKTDIAIWRPSAGAWWYLSSINGQQVNVNFGASGDIPRPSDFDGDGKTDFVLYRPSNSTWYRMSATGQVAAPFAFGIAEDKPLIGDFDGDGKSDPAVFRPSSGDWWYAPSSATDGHFAVVHWGASGDIPTPADVDADGKTDFMVYRPSNGGWYILRSGEQNYTILQFGLPNDKPVVADYDGDGKADVAVFRPSTGTWYLLQTTSGFGAVQWGNSLDIATPNAFLP